MISSPPFDPRRGVIVFPEAAPDCFVRAATAEDGMAYKYKPNKAVAKRFKVTKTGKLKRHHSFTSHLMSSRPANKRRKLRRSAVLFEGHARNMREFMGIGHLHPARVEHERGLADKGQGEPSPAGEKAPEIRSKAKGTRPQADKSRSSK